MSRLAAVPPTLQPAAATLYCARQIRSGGDFHSRPTSGLTPTPVRSPSPTELLFPTIADESRSISTSKPIWGCTHAKSYPSGSQCDDSAVTEFLLTIRAKPNSSKNRVGGAYGQSLIVAVTDPAVEGKASKAIIALLSEVLQVSKSAIRIKSGERARTKIIAINVELSRVSEITAQIALLMTHNGAS